MRRSWTATPHDSQGPGVPSRGYEKRPKGKTRARSSSSRYNNLSFSKHDNIVLLDMQRRIRFNNHLDTALAFDFGDCIRFLICQQRRHARMGAHHQHGFTVRRPYAPDIAKQLVTDSDGIFGITPSIAVMAGLGERPVEILPNALAGHFHQAEVGDPEDSRAGFVVRQG